MRSGLSVVVCGLVSVLLGGCGGGNSGGSNQSGPYNPVASAGGPYTGMVGTPVSFNAAGSYDPQGQTLTYAWTFGDGSTGTGLTPTHTYAAAGAYPISVTVKDTASLSGVASSSATITAAPPVANAGGPYSGTVGTAVSFSAAGSSDPQGQPLTYGWNFGDGSATGIGPIPSHTYTAAGTYTVTLTVADTSGLMATATSKATIVAQPVAALTGIVSGGTTPIVGAHVYLLAANTTGYGGNGIAASSSNASVSLLSAALTGSSDAVGAYVTTGSNGGFSLTGEYNCASGQQIYLYVLGGNAGSGTNAASGLMAAIGACPSNTAPAVFATVNEVSTVAAAYAMAGFATDATHVSSSGTALAQVGVANAFANAGNLATLATGVALATTPAGNGVAPQATINTLADILSACVNSNGPGSISCSTLLGDELSGGSSGVAPTDTATAAINMAHNPVANNAALYALVTPSAPFEPVLSTPPYFVVGISFTGGGMHNPNAIAVDGNDNVWVTNKFGGVNSGGVLSEFSSAGVALSSANGFSGGGLIGPFSIAIDGSGDVWAVNNYGTVTVGISKFSNAGVALSPSTGYTGGGLNQPDSIAIDRFGDAWVAGSSLSEFSSTGAALSPSTGYTGGGLDGPESVAIDGSGDVWTANATGNNLSEFSSAGAAISPSAGYTGGGLDDPWAIAMDSLGNAWIAGGQNNASEFSNLGAALSPSSGYTGGGLDEPRSVAIDGAGNAWIPDINGSQVTELSSGGSFLSGSFGFQAGELDGPDGVAIDGSGDVWTANNSGGPQHLGSVTEFVGAGTPVITPICAGLPATPTANGSSNLGTRP